MRISKRSIQNRSFFPWLTLVKILMVLSSSSQRLIHHGCVKWSFILCFFLLILVGWETRRIWESNWRPGNSKGDWESGFIKWNAEDEYYHYFLWHSGRWLTFLNWLFFIFWYKSHSSLTFLFDGLRPIKVVLYVFDMTAFGLLDARNFFLFTKFDHSNDCLDEWLWRVIYRSFFVRVNPNWPNL